MGSDRLVRQLCWALVALSIITAILSLGITFALFVPFPEIAETTDHIDEIAAWRAADTQLYPFALVNALASAALFAVVALLGVALRPFATGGSLRDVMTTLFVVGGVLGIVAQTANLALAHAATFGFCDCGYRTEELVAQDYALSVGWNLAGWLSNATFIIAGTSVALAGRVLDISSTFRTMSYLIAVVLFVAVALHVVASLTFISAFDPFFVRDVLVAIAAGIMVPIWAIILARSIHRLRIWTGGIAAAPAADA